MEHRPGYFGGSMRVYMDIGHQPETLLDRELWFDLDIDGRGLVGVNGADPAGEPMMGAVIVRDKAIGYFIETLGQLIANPAEFAHDPVLMPIS